MRKFFLIANEDKKESILLSANVKAYLESKGCEVKSVTGYVKKEMIEAGTECIVVFGGDGTLLNAARELQQADIPFLGINVGRLGFLAGTEKDDVYEAMDKLMADDYNVEARMMLSGDVVREGKVIASGVSLNDIVINRGGGLSILEFNMYVNGLHLNTYNADGLIVSTPTGSTAYSMSAGGPIVKPSASLIVVTPVCPHTLNTRSIVLDPTDVVELEVIENRKYENELGSAYFDGEHMCTLCTGDKLVIKKAEVSTKIIKLSSVGFLEILRRKMSNNENCQTK